MVMLIERARSRSALEHGEQAQENDNRAPKEDDPGEAISEGESREGALALIPGAQNDLADPQLHVANKQPAQLGPDGRGSGRRSKVRGKFDHAAFDETDQHLPTSAETAPAPIWAKLRWLFIRDVELR
ncbi:MAG: hypothetical protein ACT4TC_23235, partial [Myxococcaceae bacterium]